jgi:hypothetical protein
VVNNIFADETPTALAALEKPEQILIAQRITKKNKGEICNVPVECS